MKLRKLLHEVKTNGEVPDIEVDGVSEKINDCENKLLILKTPPLAAQYKNTVVLAQGDNGIDGCITTPDIRKAICRIYSNFYNNPENKLSIIGVTGTNGKTTTAMLISHILKKCGIRCAFSGTVSESGYTTPPPSILFKKLNDFVSDGYTHLAMEVSSHGLIQNRVGTVNFSLGVLTNISRDHLDYHGSMQNYINAKKLLFKQCDLKLINRDSDCFSAFDYSDAYTYGINGGDYRASDISLCGDRVEYILSHNGKRCKIVYPVIGLFSVYNSLAAIAASHLSGADLNDAANAVSSFYGVSGRVERIEDPFYDIYIDYAHTPSGIDNLLSALRPICRGRLIILIGCGGERDRGKRPLMCTAALKGADFAVLTSDNPRTENPYAILREMLSGLNDEDTPFAVIEDRKKAIEFALKLLMKGDMLVLAGKGHELFQNVNGEKIPFNEREIIKKTLAKMRYD